MPRSQRGRMKRPPRPRPQVDRRRNPDSVDDRTLVQWAIEHGQTSAVALARDVLHCSPRTIFRVLRGESPLHRLGRDALVDRIRSPRSHEEHVS
jgi:hypothetical protein